MKTRILLLAFQLSLSPIVLSQVVCIQCFNQNSPLSPQANNRIQNGGFENTDCLPGWLTGGFCPNSSNYSCDLDQWICTGGGSASYPSIFDSTLSLIPEGQYAAYFGNGNAFICQDLSFDTSCLVREHCTVSGLPTGFPRALPDYGESTGVSLEQTISGLTIGETYVLEFWSGGEPLLGLLLEDGVFAVDVGYGKTYLTSPPTQHGSINTGVVYMVQFIASSLTHTIRFTNWGHMCADCTELVLDNVRLYTLAELSPSVESCTTSLTNSKGSENLSIFPNPTQGVLYLDNVEAENVSIHIFTPEGKVLRSIIGQDEIDTSDIPPGMYILILEQGSEMYIRKFIKL